MTDKMIGVIGSGAWGTAIASRIGQKHPILFWAREAEIARAINDKNENPVFLPDIALPKTITATNALCDLSSCSILFLAPPAQFFRSVLVELKPFLSLDAELIICSKGIEITHRQAQSGALMSQIIDDELPNIKYYILSGPSFAREVAQNKPATLTLAGEMADAQRLAQLFSQKTFTLKPCDDIIAVQISAAVKNILAIGCGLLAGANLGQNAIAAFISNGLLEIANLIEAMGANKATLFEPAGIGDIILTCTSNQSRNHSLGYALGQGKRLDAVLGSRQSVSEGVWTARAISHLARQHAIIMPLCFAIDDLLQNHISQREALDYLTSSQSPSHPPV